MEFDISVLDAREEKQYMIALMTVATQVGQAESTRINQPFKDNSILLYLKNINPLCT